MGRSERRKGADGEREACRLLQDFFGQAVKRSLNQPREGSVTADIEIGRFSIEVKRRSKLTTLYGWVKQADEGRGVPVVMVRADGEEFLVVQRFKDWAVLAREEIDDWK